MVRGPSTLGCEGQGQSLLQRKGSAETPAHRGRLPLPAQDSLPHTPQRRQINRNPGGHLELLSFHASDTNVFPLKYIMVKACGRPTLGELESAKAQMRAPWGKHEARVKGSIFSPVEESCSTVPVLLWDFTSNWMQNTARLRWVFSTEPGS